MNTASKDENDLMGGELTSFLCTNFEYTVNFKSRRRIEI